jgi:F-type H+-transporting ATPase subunit epsilon
MYVDWRVAGMSYIKYSNLCADMVRAALKEPMKSKAKAREVIYYRSAVWKNGAPEKQGEELFYP